MLQQPENQRSVKILIVEDDEDILFGMQDVLEGTDVVADNTYYNISILSAKDGQAGLEVLETETPDLIISDVMMPRLSGYQFLEKVQTQPQFLHIPFIFLTARDTSEDRHKGLLQGASLYLTKPFDKDTLIEHVGSQLKKSFARQEAQEQYLASFKKQILKVLNHEFRTPLTYVTAYYEMLAYKAKSSGTFENYQEYLRGIQAGCIRLSKLIENFMLVMELNSGEAKETFQNQAELISDLSSIIRQAIDQNELLSLNPDVEIRLNIPKDLPTIVGVRFQVYNIFAKIIDNAVKFSLNSSRKAVIEIDAQACEQEIQIKIQDNGHGMPLHIVDKIFDLFYQYNRDSNEQQGTGAGLNIALGLTMLHNGRIEVETIDEVGSTFTIVFPENDRISSEDPTYSTRKKAIVLAVEDDPHLLDGLQDLLQAIPGKYKLEVLKAQDGLEGLEILKQQLPDLIISDIMMPKMSGYDFLQEVRKKPEWLHIPVIFLTAKGKSPDKHKAYIMGVDEYITKPYESDLLIKYIESQLDRRFTIQKMIDQNFDALKKSILNLITPNFRQPLSFVTQYVNKLTDSVSNVQTVTEFKDSLQGIQTGSEWLNRLIEDFMILAELKTGEANDAFQLQSQRIPNIGVVLSEFSQMHSAKLASEDINLEFEPFDTQLAPVFGNITQILGGFSRLLEVGIKHRKDDGPLVVRISAEEEGAQVVIQMAFQAGLSDDIANTIAEILAVSDDDIELFRSFEFAPDLSIAQGYISLHGGTIKLNHEGDSIFDFSIRLPTIS